MIKGASLLLAAGLVIAVSWGVAGLTSAQENITIGGTVTNGTQGGQLPSDLEVMLHSFDRASGSVGTTVTRAETGGQFAFTGVLHNTGDSYAVSLEYGGMLYTTLVDPEDATSPVQLTIYEPTQDVSVIRVKRQALVIADVNTSDEMISAVVFVSFSNTSDRTLVPDLNDVGQISFLRFSLPPEATDLDVQSDLPGGDVIAIGTGFALTSPVVPGKHNINYSFRFPYRSGSMSYRESFLQGAEVYQVMVPQRLSGIQVSPLSPMADVDIRGSVYQVWEGRDYPPRQSLTLDLSQLPQPSPLARVGKTLTTYRFWGIAIPSAVGAALAFLLVYGGIKGRREN